jgi:hypothetical protein
VEVPNLGFLFDRAAGAIRPVTGVPGAALTGDPVMPARNAAIAPGGRWAVVDSAGDEPVGIWRLDANPPLRVYALDGAWPAEGIVFSPGGGAAVLVRLSENALEVLTGLPDAPAVHSLADVPEGSRIFAVNDQGDVLAGGGSVWLLRENQPPRPLPVSGPVSAMAFQGSDALLAGSWETLLVRNLPEGSHYRTLAVHGDNRIPAAAHLSPGATHAFTAAEDGEILVIPLQAGDPTRLSCRCRPAGFTPLAGGSLYQLTEGGNDPLWLLDAAAQPRFWFVPRPLVPDALEGSAQ